MSYSKVFSLAFGSVFLLIIFDIARYILGMKMVGGTSETPWMVAIFAFPFAAPSPNTEAFVYLQEKFGLDGLVSAFTIPLVYAFVAGIVAVIIKTMFDLFRRRKLNV
jgi:hypothetical protein